VTNVASQVAVLRRTVTRAVVPALLAVACIAVAPLAAASGNPPAATAQGAVAPDAKATEEKRQRIETLARREGYRTIERSGERMYCREEEITGTRTRRQRTCFTEDQLELQVELERSAAGEILDRGLRGFTKRDP